MQINVNDMLIVLLLYGLILQTPILKKVTETYGPMWVFVLRL